MTFPIDSEKLALVVRAIQLGINTAGCCEWEDRAFERLSRKPPCEEFTADGIKEFLCRYVSENPESVSQVVEKRAEYRDQPYYYKVILPIAEFSRGLFVEIRLIDRDPEYPVVWIVNAHEQGR